MIRVPEHLQGLSGEDLKNALLSDRRKQAVLMVTRQTDYSVEEAEKKLEEANNNYMKVIKDFLGIEEETKQETGTVNQRIYGEIRNLMDTGAQQYRAHKEKQEKIAIYKEKVMAARAAAAAAAAERAKQDELTSDKNKLGPVEETNEN